MANPRLCSIPDCGKPLECRGLCNKHYIRLRKGRDVYASLTERHEPLKFFESVVLQYDGDECLIWPFGKALGYGRIRYKGRDRPAHRLVCEIIYGPAPQGKPHAAHNCGKGNVGCVTKRHLEWKSVSDNQMDRVSHGTSNRGEAHGRGKLNEEQVREIRSSSLGTKELAANFSISRRTITDIRRRRSWSWLT